MKKETLYSILNRVEGLESIEPDDPYEGPPYTVEVEGYEFLVTEELEIKYQGEANGILPEIVNINKYTINEEIRIKIQTKTEDKLGLDKLVLIKNGVKIEEKDINGNNITDEFIINGNGTYQIKVVGKNGKTVTSEKLVILEMSKISGILQAGKVIEGEVLLTITGQVKDTKVEKIEIYEGHNKIGEIGREQIHINQVEKTENIEATYQVKSVPFYGENSYIAKIIVEETSADTNEVNPQNVDTIKTLIDLQNFATQVNTKNNSFQDKTIYLIDDITTNENWIPIGYWNGISGWENVKCFSGTFEGNNHTITIKSLSKNEIYKSSGLFGGVSDGIIKNLTISGILDAQCLDVGGITGLIKNGYIESCINTSNITNESFSVHGGIVGKSETSTIRDCVNYGSIKGYTQVGGICGFSEADSKIYDCMNQGDVTCCGTQNEFYWSESGYKFGIVGGIVGKANDTNIDNCTNGTDANIGSNKVLDNLITGGIAGCIKNTDILKSKNNGKVYYGGQGDSDDSAESMGGIVGWSLKSNIKQCFNTGIITSKLYTGEITLSNVGGIVGGCGSSSGKDGSVVIENVYNTGKVSGNNYVGGIIGIAQSITYLYNCYNATEQIDGNRKVGNFIGNSSGTVTTTNLAWIKGTTFGICNTGWTCNLYEEYTIAEMKNGTKGSTTLLSLLELLSKGNGNGIWTQENGTLPYLINNKP